MSTASSYPAKTIAALREDSFHIIDYVLAHNQPHQAVQRALKQHLPTDDKRIYLLSIGKAAWTMAKAAVDVLQDRLIQGMIITKTGHSQGALKRCQIFEAGHPVVDERSLYAGKQAIAMASSLGAHDRLVLLISGGGSALFESTPLSLDELQQITAQLLDSGADIVEVNTIRKRLSLVKGGKFAQICAPAEVCAIVLSDVIGNHLDSIASGPVAPDSTTSSEAQDIIDRYQIQLSEKATQLLSIKTPKETTGVVHHVIGSVETLCTAAAQAARERGYTPHITDTQVTCDVGAHARHFVEQALKLQAQITAPAALIAGGECTVTVRGSGTGGRNQEFALIAGQMIEGNDSVVIFSLGSDGSDGPTDAAGGICDGASVVRMKANGINACDAAANNDSYHALKASGDLLITGPTGTNINDLQVALILPDSR